MNNIKIYADYAELTIISTTHGTHATKIDIADVELIKDKVWHIQNHRTAKDGTKAFYVGHWMCKGNMIRLHRYIMGTPPSPGMVIDHLDCDRLNNQRSNLRWVTSQTNRRNTKYSLGITPHPMTTKNCYVVRISTGTGRHYSKACATPQAAWTLRREWEIKYFGFTYKDPECPQQIADTLRLKYESARDKYKNN